MAKVSLRKEKKLPLTPDKVHRLAKDQPEEALQKEEGPVTIASLQQQMGNRALQRLLEGQSLATVQRQPDSAPATPNLLDPALLASAAQKVINESQAPVRSWLDANTENLRQRTIEELVARVRLNVPQAAKLADLEIQSLAREWAASKNIQIPVIPPAGTVVTDPTLQIPDAVKKAFSIATEGVNVTRLPGGKLNISVKGVTAKLKRAEINIGWGGSLGIDIPVKGFQLSGKLDKDTWEINLSAPGESSVPDLSRLADVFRKAETGLRDAISATAQLNTLDDPAKVMEAISPSIQPVKEAVEALQKISESPTVSFGISASGSTPGDKSPGGQSPGGVTLTATLTIRF
jgi:hypothetical protein